MDKRIVELLKKSRFSDRAIEYYLKKVNVGQIEEPDLYSVYTGPCGDTMEISLKVTSGIIKDAKFQAVGCAGAFSSGSALCEMIKGKTLDEAKNLSVEDIIEHLGGLPKAKIHCACLAKMTLKKVIDSG
ncbi:MAG: iron-sulfur cluster assembly scaffold protein [bacterium]